MVGGGHLHTSGLDTIIRHYNLSSYTSHFEQGDIRRPAICQ